MSYLSDYYAQKDAERANGSVANAPAIKEQLRNQLKEQLPDVTPEQIEELMTMATNLGVALQENDANEDHEATAPAAQNVHRIEIQISGGLLHGLRGEITFKGVCDAKPGAPCRMWCNQPECLEEAQDGHGTHTLVDQGKCGVIGTLNADPACIPELYDGVPTQLRPAFIDLVTDCDGVTWSYSQNQHEPHPCECR